MKSLLKCNFTNKHLVFHTINFSSKELVNWLPLKVFNQHINAVIHLLDYLTNRISGSKIK